MKPIQITQPQGANFTIDGNFVEWQKWNFHVRFERRPGTVISLVTYDGRPVMYQGSLAEIFVPYQDPDVNWFYRTYMDAGEFGFGLLSSPLKLGLDVPANAVLLDALVSAAIPDPERARRAAAAAAGRRHLRAADRQSGVAPLRALRRSVPAYEGRADVELVVRSIAQLGNYDYMVDWVFNQSGAIRVDVALTGIDAPKGVRSTIARLADRRRGHEIRRAGRAQPRRAQPQPPLQLPPRPRHRRAQQQLRAGRAQDQGERAGPAQERAGRSTTSAWTASATGKLDEDEALWKVVNPNRTNARGYNTGYLVESHSHADPLLKKADFKRAGFIEHTLWITRFNADQRFASGDTPNQNPGEPGLPDYQPNNQSIVNTDIVLWLTIGHHHVTATEDLPVLSRETMSFKLKPVNFFDRNPALDLRRAPFEAP